MSENTNPVQVATMNALVEEVNYQAAVASMAASIANQLTSKQDHEDGETHQLDRVDDGQLYALGVTSDSLRRHTNALRAVEAATALGVATYMYAGTGRGDIRAQAEIGEDVTVRIRGQRDVLRTLPNGSEHKTPLAFTSRLEFHASKQVPGVAKLAKFIPEHQAGLTTEENLVGLLKSIA